jgi:hypothetical protein
MGLEQTERAKLGGHMSGQLVPLPARLREIRRRCGRLQITPPLEGTMGRRYRSDMVSVNPERAVALALLIHAGVNAENGLPDEDASFHDPIDGAAGQDLLSPFRHTARKDGNPVVALDQSGTARLHLHQMIKVVDADGKLYEMKGHGRSRSLIRED